MVSRVSTSLPRTALDPSAAAGSPLAWVVGRVLASQLWGVSACCQLLRAGDEGRADSMSPICRYPSNQPDGENAIDLLPGASPERG
jgi:hypothetical protein